MPSPAPLTEPVTVPPPFGVKWETILTQHGCTVTSFAAARVER